jgi:hypothetical protein
MAIGIAGGADAGKVSNLLKWAMLYLYINYRLE